MEGTDAKLSVGAKIKIFLRRSRNLLSLQGGQFLFLQAYVTIPVDQLRLRDTLRVGQVARGVPLERV